MPSSQSANPEMLILARRSRDFTQQQLADRMAITQGAISKYESGVIPLNEPDLGKIAAVLEYRPRFFFQCGTLEGPGISESFHRKRQAVSALVLHRVYALAEMRRRDCIKLLNVWQSPDIPFPQYPVEDFEANPEKVARTVRALWRVPMGPIFSMTKAIEQAGGIVFQFDFGTRQIDGFSHRSPSLPPLFFLNEDLMPDRWRWTLAHELGHIVMHIDPSKPARLMEEEADRFAGEFLAPADELKVQLWNLDFQKLAGLKKYWKISIQALIMQAFHLGAISERQRRNMFMRLTKAGYRMREPVELDPAFEPPGTPYELIRFHKTVLEYDDEDIQELLGIYADDMRAFYRDPRDHLAGIRLPLPW